MLIKYRSTKAVKDVRDKIGNALIRQGFAQLYQTRDMQSAPPGVEAPYGFKADGTPRKRAAPKKA